MTTTCRQRSSGDEPPGQGRVPLDNIRAADAETRFSDESSLCSRGTERWLQHRSRWRPRRGRVGDQELRDGVPDAGRRSRGGTMSDPGERWTRQSLYGLNTEDRLPRYYCAAMSAGPPADRSRCEQVCGGHLPANPDRQQLPVGPARADPQVSHQKKRPDHRPGRISLVSDLKQLAVCWETTVVLWAGEMGRTPHTPRVGPDAGRDHHVNGYSLFGCLAAGSRAGRHLGRPTSSANSVAENPADGP